MWFVWVQTVAGPMPEKWTEEQGDVDIHGQTRPFLKKVHLPEAHMNIPLDHLARQFPLSEESSHESYKTYIESTDTAD